MTGIACSNCRYYRPAPPVRLFTDEDLINPDVQQVQSEVDELVRSRAHQEGQFVEATKLTDWEPSTQAWCWKYSGGINRFFDAKSTNEFMGHLRDPKERVRARVLFRRLYGDASQPVRRDPVSGEPKRYYALTKYLNGDGCCDQHKLLQDEPSESANESSGRGDAPDVEVDIDENARGASDSTPRIHLGRTLELESFLDATSKEATFQRVGADGFVAPVDQMLLLDQPGMLGAQRLRYKLQEGNGSLYLSGAGLKVSYGIFGAPGSGKTYLFKFLLRQLLAYRRANPDLKYGALILDPKAALIEEIRAMVATEAVARTEDLMVLNAQEMVREGVGLNVIHVPTIKGEVLAGLLVLSARSAGITASENFWFLEWENLFEAALYLLNHFDQDKQESLSCNSVTLKLLLDSLLIQHPDGTRGIQRLAERARLRLDGLKDANARSDSVKAINEIDRFFRTEHVDTVLAFISRAYGPFQRSHYACYSPKPKNKAATISLYDQIVNEGKIVLVSVSPSDPLIAKALCTLVKCLFQQTVLQRNHRDFASKGEKKRVNCGRPLLLACDEFSEIASEIPGQPMGDGRFFSLSREFGCMGLLATQSVNVLQATSLKENWRSVFSTFGAKIFMRLADNETAKEASELAATSDWQMAAHTLSQGKEGLGSSDQKSVQQRSTLPTEVLTQVFERGQGVLIGSTDAGVSAPRLAFFKTPHEKDWEGFISEHSNAAKSNATNPVQTEPVHAHSVQRRILDDSAIEGWELDGIR